MISGANEKELELYSSLEPSVYFNYYTELIDAFETTGTFTEKLEKDEYFVMGDNRNNSTDSRYFGPISKNDMLGKVVLHVEHGQTLFNAIWKSIFCINVVKYF